MERLQCEHCQRVLEFSGDRPSYCAYCGRLLPVAPVGPTPPANGAPVSQVVGGYRLIRPIGSGGMGTVYEAVDVQSSRKVAVKLLLPEVARSSDGLQRFRQEGRLASQIAHPRCVFVLAADEQAGQPYIVMELMTGSTLDQLVREKGPLPPEQAVARILDVIEGLQEAHRVGVIHRDVKPSNCFLVPDGRVKIGDFGLAKPLNSDSHLTRSGTFLGTPLYASPEQIKGLSLDAQTDVYSVAATLYYLLTGQAPFQEKGNAAATLARIVSEPPPPLRTLRPDVSPALERVILRGLERGRERRWRTLEDFRQALLPFVPDQLSIGGMGMRLGAYLLDLVLFLPVWLVCAVLREWLGGPDWVGTTMAFLPGVLLFIYFVLTEGLGGASVGKRWMQLRVTVNGSDPPGIRPALVRTAVFLSFFFPASILFGLFPVLEEVTWSTWLALGIEAVGVGLLFSTMRPWTGFRMLHEVASGTRVLALPQGEGRRALESLVGRGALHPGPLVGLPPALGNYRVRGGLREDDDAEFLLGEDASLGREVCLMLRGRDGSPVPAERRQLERPARLRWLTAGQHNGQQWDAFLAPEGCPLTEAVNPAHPLSWAEVRPILQELASELQLAVVDRTLPSNLSMAQVWVQASGQVQLLDWPLARKARVEEPDGDSDHDARALDLLARVAVLALEGQPRPAGSPPTTIRRPLPRHARRLLNRLLGVSEPYPKLADLAADLAACRDLPAEVTRPMRAAHLGVLSLLLAFGVLSMLQQGRSYTQLHRVFQVKLLGQHIGRGEAALRLLKSRPSLAADPRGLGRQLQDQVDQDREELKRQYHELGWLARLFALDPSPDVEGWVSHFLAPERQKEEFDLAVGRATRNGEVDEARPVTVRTLLASLGGWPVLWVVWAFVTRGGLTLRMMGLNLVRADGRKASRWQCAWRAAIVWAPVVVLLALAVCAEVLLPRQAWMHTLLWSGAVLLLAGDFLLAWYYPRRSWHDRMVGTYLVPR